MYLKGKHRIDVKEEGGGWRGSALIVNLTLSIIKSIF